MHAKEMQGKFTHWNPQCTRSSLSVDVDAKTATYRSRSGTTKLPMLNVTDMSCTVKWHVEGWGNRDRCGNFKLSERCGELGLVENGTNFWKKELQRNDRSRSPCGASRNEDHEMPVLTKTSFSVTNEEISAVDAVLQLVQRALIQAEVKEEIIM